MADQPVTQVAPAPAVPQAPTQTYLSTNDGDKLNAENAALRAEISKHKSGAQLAEFETKMSEAVNNAVAQTKTETDAALNVYKNEATKLSQANAELTEKLKGVDGLADKHKASTEALKSQAEIQFNALADDAKEKIQKMSSWSKDDPLSQLQAINDYQIANPGSGRTASGMFPAGAPGKSKDAKNDVLKTGSARAMVNSFIEDRNMGQLFGQKSN